MRPYDRQTFPSGIIFIGVRRPLFLDPNPHGAPALPVPESYMSGLDFFFCSVAERIEGERQVSLFSPGDV